MALDYDAVSATTRQTYLKKLVDVNGKENE